VQTTAGQSVTTPTLDTTCHLTGEENTLENKKWAQNKMQDLW